MELGSVKDVGIAEVKVNGVPQGTVWTAPFRVALGQVPQNGTNTLEINVINSWFNRVAGDQIYPDKKQYTSTNVNLFYDYLGNPRSEIPLEPSGLLGPVRIMEPIAQ